MSSSGGTSNPHEGINVVPDEVREIGRYAYDLAQTLRSAVDTAAREVRTLTDDSWHGTAAAEFTDDWTEVYDGGGQLMAALMSLAEKLGVTADSYRSQDENAAAPLRSSSLDL